MVPVVPVRSDRSVGPPGSAGRSRFPYRSRTIPAARLYLRQSVRALRRCAAWPPCAVRGVYGAVPTSSMVAALTEQGEMAPAERFSSAQWLLVTAVAP